MIRKITLFVCLAHLLLLLVMGLLSAPAKKHHPLIVRTIRPQPTSIQTVAAPPAKIAIAQPAISTPIATSKPQKKPAIKKMEKKTPSSQKILKQNENQQLLAADKLLQALEKIEKKATPATHQEQPLFVDLPKSLPPLHIHQIGSHRFSASYEEKIHEFLTDALTLPEVGSVKMQVTIDRFGKVISFKTIQAQSKKNQQYLEKELLTLIFPQMEEMKKGCERFTFFFTFLNQKSNL